MVNISADDYNILKQQYIKKYIRLELLDFQYNIVDEMSGNMTACSVSCDSTSDIRRTCSISFVVTTSTFDIKSGQKIWLDKFVRPYVGYENMRTGEIQWYNQGIYLVNNPQWNYDAATNEISMQAVDLMAKLTGLRNGNLEGIPTKIAKDENVREAIIATLELGGFTKYVCEECLTNDGTIVPVPYDIEIDVGGTVYDVLSQLRDIMPNYQIYFDVDGVFHYEQIPLGYDAPVVIDDDLFNNVLISENINTDFESVKNYVEVLGHTWDVDYYSPSDKTTVSGTTIMPTFADLKELQDGTAIGITLPTDIENPINISVQDQIMSIISGATVANEKMTLDSGSVENEVLSLQAASSSIYIDFLGKNKIVDINNADITRLDKDTEWIFQAVTESSESELPEGYTQLEYIQSSGTQWIDTGFKPNQNTRVLADCDLISGVYPTAFGAWSSSSGSKYILLALSDTVARYYYNLTETDKNVAIKGRHTLDMNKNKLIVDNAEIVTVASSTFSVSQSLYLFTFHGGETTENFKTNAKYYSCKIYDNDVLVRDFIPCKNADGVIGMYDVVNSQFYQNAGIGVFTAGGEVQPAQQMKFWRFMGHQQAQAISYDNNPSSPFYVGDPIGSSSVGRIRIVLYGGEYDNIYSDDLAKQRADFEIYQRSRLNDSITMTTIPIPWIDANIVVSHRFGQKETASKYIVKSYNADYATGGTMTINAITWYPYYESEV